MNHFGSRSAFFVIKIATAKLEILNEIMKWRAIRHIPVVGDDNRLVGLLTYKDLLEITLECQNQGEDCKKSRSRICIGEVMKTDLLAITADTSVSEAARQMRGHRYGCLPVIEGEDHKLVGIVTEADFVNFFVDWDVFKEKR